MIFANGVKKAGFFKENVLIELITDKKSIKMQENLTGPFPPDFREELIQYIEQNVPKEEDN